MPLNLIIPMAGKGSRFKKKGYSNYKPFIKIFKYYMYEYVINHFPKEVQIWIITCKEYINKSHLDDLIKKNIKVLFISPHTLGPAYSILKCKNYLPLDESFFISYCDIDWTWNFKKIEINLDVDGIVFTNKSFHPHKLLNNYSAFCKTKDNKLLEIKEKESFTNDWMQEELSIGLFYIKSGIDMITSIHSLVKKNIKVSNEFFPSLIFNELLKKKKKIITYNLDYFIHWGIPEQLEDYISWKNKILRIKNFKPSSTANNSSVICMGGKSSRIKKLNLGNKAFINILSKPMFKFISDFFPLNNKKTIISTKKIFNENPFYFDKYEKFPLSRNTNSQIETLKQSIKKLKNIKNFFLLSCDAFGFFNFNLFNNLKKKNKADVIIFLFNPSLIQKMECNAHTYVSIDRMKIIKSINIKKKKEKIDRGLAGFFWFKDGNIFDELKKMKKVNKTEPVIDHFVKHLHKKNMNVQYINLSSYIHLGTINELNEFNFWANKFK